MTTKRVKKDQSLAERLLLLWKDTATKNHLDELIPIFVRDTNAWGTFNRLLVVRWNSHLELLESMVNYSTDDASPKSVLKQKCHAALIEPLLQKINDSRVVTWLCDAEIPLPLLSFLSEKPSVPLLLYHVGTQENRKIFMVLELALEEESPDFFKYVNEFCGVLMTVIEREAAFRKLLQLRESAEAEKEAILTKLGRQDLTTENIVGNNTGLQGVLERVELIAPSNTPVMIFGESGSGKAVIARAIHHRSVRGTRAFFRVNCGAMTPEWIGAQLFGDQKPGLFERVNGGTLFLDDIHELPMPAQSRLLRLLDQGVLEPINGHEQIDVDVRLIVATDRDLGMMVSNGTFREDLWYKIASFPIRIPSLRERLDDLPDLARHFAERAATRFGLPKVMPTTRDIELLKTYSWPGNIRELGVVIDRATLLGNGKSLDIMTALGVPATPQNAPVWYDGQRNGSRRNDKSRWHDFQSIEPLDDILRRYFEYVLGVTRGKIEGDHGAADLLEINPNTLRAKLKKLQIDWKRFK